MSGSKWHPPLENQCLGVLHPFPASLCFAGVFCLLAPCKPPPGGSWLGESWGGIQGAKASPTAALGPPKVLLLPLAAVPFPSTHHWPSLGSCQKLQPGTPCLARESSQGRRPWDLGPRKHPPLHSLPNLSIHPSPLSGRSLAKLDQPLALHPVETQLCRASHFLLNKC